MILLLFINRILEFSSLCVGLQFVLFELMPNLASHFARSPLNHSNGYGSAADRPNCLAKFALILESFMKYAG
jgi:hypothetical protein